MVDSNAVEISLSGGVADPTHEATPVPGLLYRASPDVGHLSEAVEAA